MLLGLKLAENPKGAATFYEFYLKFQMATESRLSSAS